MIQGGTSWHWITPTIGFTTWGLPTRNATWGCGEA